MKKPAYSEGFKSEVIALAWADDVSFDKIKQKLGLSEADVIKVMRGNLKPGSFKLWRERVSGRKAKHAKLMRPAGQLRKDSDDDDGEQFLPVGSRLP